MERIQESGEIAMTAKQSSGKSSSTKFFGIIALITIGFGSAIALFDLMFSPVLSALAGLVFIFFGSACAMIAAAKFLEAMDQRINKDH